MAASAGKHNVAIWPYYALSNIERRINLFKKQSGFTACDIEDDVVVYALVCHTVRLSPIATMFGPRHSP